MAVGFFLKNHEDMGGHVINKAKAYEIEIGLEMFAELCAKLTEGSLTIGVKERKGGGRERLSRVK